MNGNQKGPVGGPRPSPVACPGFPGADLPASQSAPSEPVPGLLDYLQSRAAHHKRMQLHYAQRIQDKRASYHTKRTYARECERHVQAEITVNDLIGAYRATLAQPDAALDRLEQKWREEAAAEWTHCQNKELSEWVRDRCYGQHNRLLSCADELATLRATLHPSRTPPHEHPKQRSGSDTSSRENNQHGMAKP